MLRIETPSCGSSSSMLMALTIAMSTRFIQAFHEDAWIFFTHRDGTLYKGLIADSFEEWATPPAQRIVGRVISLTHAKVSLGSKGAMGTARLRRA
jgi:hypothetical protein